MRHAQANEDNWPARGDVDFNDAFVADGKRFHHFRLCCVRSRVIGRYRIAALDALDTEEDELPF